MSQQRNIVIIGSGMAGYTLLREIRKLDAEIDITLICADRGDFYSKPMLSNALAGAKTADKLVTQSTAAMVKSLDFELIANTQVIGIDAQRQLVNTATQSLHFQKLVLAVGARPIVLPMQGDAATDILSVNHLDDYRFLREKLELASSVAIIGPGLIGCEFANDLLSIERPVSVIGPDAWPISTLLPQAVGRFLQARLESAGVRFFLRNGVTAVDHVESGYRLTLQDDEAIEAGLVLSAVGLRADLTLAKQAGLQTSRGILTDATLQSSAHNIYALGDCAEIAGYHLPFIMPIMHAARALAQTLTGTVTAAKYPPMPVVIKTPACPLVVAVPPLDKTPATWSIEESDAGVRALAYRDEALVGFALAGDSAAEKQQLTRSLPSLF